MTPLTMHRFWSIVEDSQSSFLLNMDDHTLERWLVRELRTEQALDHVETDAISQYIRTHLPLIREIAMAC
ncbi:MAG: hypothetical protein AAFY26_04310 [Cyanobacteria bacterium J06638_22]